MVSRDRSRMQVSLLAARSKSAYLSQKRQLLSKSLGPQTSGGPTQFSRYNVENLRTSFQVVVVGKGIFHVGVQASTLAVFQMETRDSNCNNLAPQPPKFQCLLMVVPSYSRLLHRKAQLDTLHFGTQTIDLKVIP